MSNPKSAWPDSILKKLMGPEPVTFSARDLTNMVHGTSCEGQKKGTQIWVNGRLHAMLVFFRFGASILYNINWARGLTYLCTVDVRMDMTHVGCSEKLARSWMSSTTTSAIVACLRLGHRILP